MIDQISLKKEPMFRVINFINTPFQATQVSIRLLLSFAVFGVAFVAIADVPASSFFFQFARIIIIAVALSIVVLPVRYSVPLLVMMLITGRDLDTQTTASIWNFSFSVVHPTWIVFLLVAVQVYKMRKSLRIPTFLRLSIVWFSIIPFFTGVGYGGLIGGETTSQWIIDLKFPMMMFGTYLLIWTFIKLDNSKGIVVLSVLVAGLAARHVVDLYYFLIGYGPTFTNLVEGSGRVSLDSTKSGILFLLILGVLLASMIPKKAAWGLLMAIPAVLLAEVYSTRMIWVEFFMTIPIILIMVKGRQIALAIVIIVTVLLAGSGALYVLNRSTAEFAFGRAQKSTLGEDKGSFKADVEYNFISRIDPIRYAEAVNILANSIERKSWLLGSGYGSYYTDDEVGYKAYYKSAFSELDYETGRFHRAHNYVVHFFLKYGLVGLALISSFWVLPTYILIRRFRRTSETPSTVFLLTGALAAFMLTAMFEQTWSGKGYALNGTLIALMTHFALQTMHRSGDLSRIRKWLS